VKIVFIGSIFILRQIISGHETELESEVLCFVKNSLFQSKISGSLSYYWPRLWPGWTTLY